jgi:hypothetical protein
MAEGKSSAASPFCRRGSETDNTRELTVSQLSEGFQQGHRSSLPQQQSHCGCQQLRIGALRAITVSLMAKAIRLSCRVPCSQWYRGKRIDYLIDNDIFNIFSCSEVICVTGIWPDPEYAVPGFCADLLRRFLSLASRDSDHPAPLTF